MEVIEFGPHVVKTSLSDDDFEKIRVLCEKAERPLNHILAGQIEYEKTFHNDVGQEFFEILEPHFQEYLKLWGVKRYDSNLNFDIRLDNIWLNKMVAGEYNPLHNHSGDVSFVLYVNVPEEIKQEENPTTSMPMGAIEMIYGKDTHGYPMNHFLDPTYSYVHTPQDNELLIFPAFLFHHVQTFRSNVERISLAGNFDFKITGES